MPLLHNRLPQNQWYKAAIILLRSQILWVGHSDKTQCGGGGGLGDGLISVPQYLELQLERQMASDALNSWNRLAAS